MKKSEIFNATSEYERLESLMVRYKDLAEIEVVENNESFISLNSTGVPSGYMPEMSDMERVLGNTLFVRNTVGEMLQGAQSRLQQENPALSLYVTYGYRSLEIQTQRFLKLFKDVDLPYFDDPADLYEEMHRYVAVPTVAGHPTGGAVDIKIKDTRADTFIDFGSRQYDFTTKDCYVFSPFISKSAAQNRMLLRKTMTAAGFAPFDGEWWHFSYGDKEWAFYYKKPYALYEQKQLAALSI